jgi:hypothetical protein
MDNNQIVTLPLTRGQLTIVDVEHAEWVNQWKWNAVPWTSGRYAAQTRESVELPNGRHRQRTRYLARMLWEHVHGLIPEGMRIIHLNGDTLDNRMENLACGTRRQALQRYHARRRHQTLTCHPNVEQGRRAGFVGRLRIGDERWSSGQFDSEEEAYAAVLAKLRELGEPAPLPGSACHDMETTPPVSETLQAA